MAAHLWSHGKQNIWIAKLVINVLPWLCLTEANCSSDWIVSPKCDMHPTSFGQEFSLQAKEMFGRDWGVVNRPAGRCWGGKQACWASLKTWGQSQKATVVRENWLPKVALRPPHPHNGMCFSLLIHTYDTQFKNRASNSLSLWYLVLYSFFKLLFNVFYIILYCMLTCLCVHHVHAWGVQRQVLDSLELKLRMIVNHHVVAETWTQILCKSSEGS